MKPSLALTACLLLASTGAHAKPHKPHVSDAATEKKARAQKLVGEGRAFFDGGNFQGAIERFEEAYRLFPVPKMLYNLGITYDALHRDDRAVCVLEQFVAKVPDADPALRSDATERVGRLRTRVARIEVTAPQGALLFLDGEERGAAPHEAPLCATEGKHRVDARSGSGNPVGLDVTAAAGAVLRIALDPAANSAKLLSDGAAAAAVVVAPDEPPPPLPTPVESPHPKKPVWKKAWFWSVLGVVVAGGAAAGVVVATRPVDVAAPTSDFGPFAVFN